MIGRLNHVAIAVPDIDDSARRYREAFRATVSEYVDMPGQGVTAAFVELHNTKVELITPLGTGGPLEKFLQRNPGGGIHHLCYEVEDIVEARDRLLRDGARILGSGEPSPGAHGKPILFLHPKDFDGVLIELEEA